ncbi:sensor histidine kinase [Portibacter marinus]|uniref:sensor histidine kinase n=1 Tax=Portibacter marinus TaxID=2898660 RepID=UPI001F3EB05C|nr:HAMP domain-containing sensor histidine kinase [Portibacter marinus]
MWNRIPIIISASSIALILLIVIQVKWMDQSRRLIEEQFDQKVNMALCMAVEEFSDCENNTALASNCKPSTINSAICFSDSVSNFVQAQNIHHEVERALLYYDITMPFELSVDESSPLLPFENCERYQDRIYSCSLNPLLDNDELQLNINFPGKQAYVLKQMELMLGLSILIMLFITSVFIYANYYLYRQKILSERNKEFFNHMAHEFKTPLTNIGLASNMLLKRNQDPLLKIIASENDQLSEQVNKVLSMASVEAGHFEIKKEEVKVKDLIEKVVRSMEIQILDKHGVISVKGIKENLKILADPFHLSNALKNILENAIKYNENVPQIEIKGVVRGDQIQLSIQDNGIGIDQKNQNLVFEKFYRIQTSESYQNKGFGLGLSYVKKIINLHDGDINIFSEWKKGTRFDLILPTIH